MPRTRSAITVGDWTELTNSVPPELVASVPMLEETHGKLQGLLAEVLQLIQERDAYQARKQEATRRIQKILEEGRTTASALRTVLRFHLGHQNEALAAFGMRPARSRKRARSPKDGADPASNAAEEPSPAVGEPPS